MTDELTHGNYPGYDVMARRDTMSWNEQTRRVIDERVGIENRPLVLDTAQWAILEAVCDRIMPQPAGRESVKLAAYVDQRLSKGKLNGYRYKGMPLPNEAWRRGLAALEEAALRDHGRGFTVLTGADQDALLRAMQHGTFRAEALGTMPATEFFMSHVIHDITGAYYAHPIAWNEIGFGGPASPRGYVRLDLDRRDAWEPAEATPGTEAKVRRENSRVV